MTEPTGKKRGRPRKLPEFVVRLGENQEKWDKWLTAFGLPKHSSSTKEILVDMLPNVMSKQRQETHLNLIGLKENDESIVLPTDWLCYLEFMDVVAEELSPKDQGANIKKLALEDARSRHNERPPALPAELGNPAEFKKRLVDHEFELRLSAKHRKQIIRIVIHPLPSHVEEDLDGAEDPNGHWEGLKWMPTPSDQ